MIVLPNIPGVRLDTRLGHGGMAVVYGGHFLDSDRTIAVKVVNCEAADKSAVLRALQEGRLAWSLRHRNLARTLDWGVLDDGRVYIVMEHLEGRDLARVLRDGPLGPARATWYVRQAAAGLVPVHERGVTHRDIKPANLFVCEGGPEPDLVKVIDLGIASLPAEDPDRLFQTAHGATYGTPGYLAPERVRGQPCGAASDVFALGATLYECLTGSVPFGGGSSLAILMRVVRAEGPPDLPPEVPEPLQQIVRSCLEPEPRRRPKNAAEVVAALDAARESLFRRRPKTAVQQDGSTHYSGDLRLPVPGDELDHERFRRHVISAVAACYRPGHLPAEIRALLAEVDRLHDQRAQHLVERAGRRGAMARKGERMHEVTIPLEAEFREAVAAMAEADGAVRAAEQAVQRAERDLADTDRAYLHEYGRLLAIQENEARRAADEGADLLLHRMLSGLTRRSLSALTELVGCRAAGIDTLAATRLHLRATLTLRNEADGRRMGIERRRAILEFQQRADLEGDEEAVADLDEQIIRVERSLECQFIALSLELVRETCPESAE